MGSMQRVYACVRKTVGSVLVRGAVATLAAACSVKGADSGGGTGDGTGWATDTGGGSTWNGGPGTNGSNGGGGSAAAPTAAEVTAGAELFAQNCAACHGADASGGPAYGGSLQGASDIGDTVRNGRGGMPAFPQLGAADVAAIEAWLQSFVNSQDPSSPQDVYAMECAGCHGATGEGTGRAPQLRSPFVGYATFVVRNGRGDMPDFDASVVAPEELDAMLAWLGSFPNPADGRGLYIRYCGNCHGPTGGGLGEEAGELRGVVRGGRGGQNYGGEFMPAFPVSRLSDAEVSKIAAYLGASGGGGEGEGDDD